MNKINEIIQSYIYLLKLQWSMSKIMFLNIIASLIIKQIFIFVPLYLSKIVFNYITSAVINKNVFIDTNLLKYVLLLLGLCLLESLYNRFTSTLEKIILISANEKLKLMFAEKAYKIKFDLYESSNTYNSYQNVLKINAEKINSFIIQLQGCINALISVILSIAVFTAGNLFIPIVLIFVYIPMFIFSYNRSIKLYNFDKGNMVVQRKIATFFSFIYDRKAIQETKIFDSSDYLINRRSQLLEKLRENTFKLNLSNANKGLVISLIPNIVYYCGYFIYAISVLVMKITIGDFTLYSGNLSVLKSNISNLTLSLSRQSSTIKHVKDIQTFLNSPEEREHHVEETNNIPFTSLACRNILYKYPGSDEYALKGVSFDINKGEKVAIVGYNGAGKSTLAKILIGLYDSYEGEYLINNSNVMMLANSDIYNIFSVAMQQYCKYPFTFKQNILIGDIHNGGDSVLFHNALAKSGCNAIMEDLYNKEYTYLNKEYDENGTDLSEGQWHSVILARTIFRNKDIVLFDEPTSSLDPIAEYNFIETLLEMTKEKTVIVISHRLSCINDFDKIFVFKDGQIVESGTHDILMSLNGEYAKMYTVQASRYVELS